MYVGRLAPSPTGAVHLGLARTFLVAWLDARSRGGHLILRVEDIDRPRVVPGSEASIMRDLAWLGMDWDEGPELEGARGPYRQSERDSLYEAALARLEELGRTFTCTCSRKEVAGRADPRRHGVTEACPEPVEEASAPHGDSESIYPGTCRNGPRPRAGRTPSIRFRTEPNDFIAHDDALYGETLKDVHREAGDFVIRRADGLWAYQLAVTVDDLRQGVTCVVRGRDLLASTPRQLLLRKLLDPAAPPLETLHVPLLLGPDGQRLAKRDGSGSLAELEERGVRPQRVLGFLASTIGICDPGTEASVRELLAVYDRRRLTRRDFTLKGMVLPS
ncbi:MAG: tRNA glutamyl-Q(34) synthetase GluQRS [Deltaproteobacteria bacterium]|nr:tRNA glutamyl-Q(34) synthetase GluQRS [Deltaproteobacteria bacterium]